MAIDPNVQVAFVSVIATAITTSGVIAVALINSQRNKVKEEKAGIYKEDDVDDRDIIERLLSLLDENQRKELTITKLKRQNRELSRDNRRLREILRNKGENPNDP